MRSHVTLKPDQLRLNALFNSLPPRIRAAARKIGVTSTVGIPKKHRGGLSVSQASRAAHAANAELREVKKRYSRQPAPTIISSAERLRKRRRSEFFSVAIKAGVINTNRYVKRYLTVDIARSGIEAKYLAQASLEDNFVPVLTIDVILPQFWTKKTELVSDNRCLDDGSVILDCNYIDSIDFVGDESAHLYTVTVIRPKALVSSKTLVAVTESGQQIEISVSLRHSAADLLAMLLRLPLAEPPPECDLDALAIT